MTDQALPAKVGQTIWGPAWQAPMAEALSLPAALKLADLDPQIVST